MLKKTDRAGVCQHVTWWPVHLVVFVSWEFQKPQNAIASYCNLLIVFQCISCHLIVSFSLWRLWKASFVGNVGKLMTSALSISFHIQFQWKQSKQKQCEHAGIQWTSQLTNQATNQPTQQDGGCQVSSWAEGIRFLADRPPTLALAQVEVLWRSAMMRKCDTARMQIMRLRLKLAKIQLIIRIQLING